MADYETTDATPLTDTVKYYQIAVPGYQSVPAPAAVTLPSKVVVTEASGTTAATTADITAFTGNSFLRIGSGPLPASDWTTAPFLNSVTLAKLVGDPAGILAAEGITVAGGAITSTNYDDSNASTLTSTTGSSSFLEGFSDGSGVQTTTSTFGTHQDSNFLLGFADDVRNRGPRSTTNALHPVQTNVNNNPVSNTNQNRQAETLRLLTKGGWWDHSDGNRVTTTSGDKIEVIQGNYKLVVLGRQRVPTPPATSVDLSQCYACTTSPPGGTNNLQAKLQAWYAGTGPTADVDTAWNAVSASWPTATAGTAPTSAQIEAQYKFNADFTTLVGNTFVTDVSGGHFQEQYPSPTPCIKTIEYVQDAGGEWTLYQDNGIGNLITKLKGRTVDLFQGARRETYVGVDPGSGPSLVHGADDLDPEIISKTWAKKIESYTGALNKPVPRIASYTWAVRSESYTFAQSIDSVTTAINTFELTIALKESVQIGNQISLFVGATESLYLGPKLDLAFPVRWQVDTAKFLAWVNRNEVGAVDQRVVGDENAVVGADNRVAAELAQVVGEVVEVAENRVAIAPVNAQLGVQVLGE